MAILKRGLAGEPVKILQEKLGVNADGQFGPATEAALKKYQQDHGLSVDGIAGPDTFLALGLPELILLSEGSHGEAVKKLQTALGVAADGKFGPGTEKALKDFQAKNGLDADGFAGPVTLSKITEFASVVTADVAAKAAAAGENFAKLATDATGAAVDASGKAVVAEVGAAPKKSIWQSITSIFGS